jgi:hypothetical protein
MQHFNWKMSRIWSTGFASVVMNLLAAQEQEISCTKLIQVTCKCVEAATDFMLCISTYIFVEL